MSTQQSSVQDSWPTPTSARRRRSAATGVIPGAVHAPRGMIEFYAGPASPYHRAEFGPDDRTILYCASAGRSALATRVLPDLGYAVVAHLDGGLEAWTAEGRPVTARD